jgi:hypothetical protein
LSKKNKLSPSQPTASWAFNILKVNRNHDMFRCDQTIIQWTEINTKSCKIALILPIQMHLPANIQKVIYKVLYKTVKPSYAVV